MGYNVTYKLNNVCVCKTFDQMLPFEGRLTWNEVVNLTTGDLHLDSRRSGWLILTWSEMLILVLANELRILKD